MTNRSSPVLVQAPAGVSFAAGAGGDWHPGGLGTGLSAAAYCWGGNGSGQLGDGTTTTNRLTPVLVLAPAGVSFAAVTGGAAHTCGLTTGLSAAAYCWGGNGSGQLGDGTKTNQLTPVLVQAPAGVAFAAVPAGAARPGGVTAAGAAYCWGDNGFGQLGDGTTTSQSSPVLVQAPPGVSFAAVTGGVADTCGVTAAGIAYCWGRNLEGQLGDGTTTDRLTPVRVVPRAAGGTPATLARGRGTSRRCRCRSRVAGTRARSAPAAGCRPSESPRRRAPHITLRAPPPRPSPRCARRSSARGPSAARCAAGLPSRRRRRRGRGSPAAPSAGRRCPSRPCLR